MGIIQGVYRRYIASFFEGDYVTKGLYRVYIGVV